MVRRLLLVFALAIQALAASTGSAQVLELGGGLSAGDVFHPSSSPLTLTDCAPALVSNSAMSGSLTINLCDATAGMVVCAIWENAAQSVIIEPLGSDTISTPEVSGAGDGLTWTATGTVGSVVCLVSLADNEWRVFSVKGSAPADNNSGP